MFSGNPPKKRREPYLFFFLDFLAFFAKSFLQDGYRITRLKDSETRARKLI